MSDENDKFETTENIDDKSKVKEDKTNLYRPLIYTFLMLTTGIGFIIGAIIFGALTSGTLCVFEIMSTFTNELGSIDGSENIADMAEEQYKSCVSRSVTSPITILAGLVGGILTGYPSYNIAKKVSNGEYLKTLV